MELKRVVVTGLGAVTPVGNTPDEMWKNLLAGVSGATIELFETDGSVGAAKGAGICAGIYKDHNEAFATLEKLQVITPDEAHRGEYLAAYARWKELLKSKL